MLDDALLGISRNYNSQDQDYSNEELSMYKSALGALALSLSLGLAASSASAQTQQHTASSTSAATSKASTSASTSSVNEGVQTYGSQTSVKEIPSNGGNPNPQGVAPAGTNSNAAAKARNDAKTTPMVTPNGSVAEVKVPPPPANTKATKATTDSATAGAATSTTKTKRKPDEMISLQVSKPMVSTKMAWQNFVDYLTLKQGQDLIPLTMTVTNAGYQSVVLNLNGSKLATEKDFKTDKLAMQMANALAVGDNKFVIQGYGKPGSKLSWTLETPRAIISDIQPATKGAIDKVTITGRNFAKSMAGDQVQVGSKWAIITLGESRKINVTLPTGLSGKQKFVVFVGGFPSKPFEFEVKAKPVVTGLDFVSAPPGQALMIMGSGFSPVIKDNIATINGVPANVTAATPNQLTVIIPEMTYPAWGASVVVKIGTVESNNNIKMNIQSRVIPNDGAGEL